MEKEEILDASRRENKNRDLAELEVSACAWHYAGRIGAAVCCLISVLASAIANTMLYGPWIIYFSIFGTTWLTRFIKLKKKSDLLMAALFLVIAVLGMIGLILRLVEVRS